MENMLGLRNQRSQVVERPDAVALPVLASGAPPLIEFDNVGYSYTSPAGGGGSQAQLLQGVSFTLEPGSMVGVVGASGCGKSTTP